MNNLKNFLWETHGIHVGTGNDHVKHGIDEIDEITELAIEKGHPNITFVIHTPRLTKFRYKAEKDTDIKFIRGDNAYFDYPEKIKRIKKKYADKINIKYGIELEWLGSDIGLQWSRSKIFQAQEADFVIGSVHFSKDSIPYDGSKEETEKLLNIRGSLENYWIGYLDEMMEMIDQFWDMIQVVGHIDLPKLYVPYPYELKDLKNSDSLIAQKMRTLIEMIKGYNLAIDVNLSGIKKGCGVYPDLNILNYAYKLNIPITVGTDTHSLDYLGRNYDKGIEYLSKTDYKSYVSFSKSIPEHRPINKNSNHSEEYNTLNLSIEILNKRFEEAKRNELPRISFGGKYKQIMESYKSSVELGNEDLIKVRKGKKSVALGEVNFSKNEKLKNVLYSYHYDKPGTLSRLFNTLASEGINVETAHLNSNSDGTAEAYLTVNADYQQINEAAEFIKGTAKDRFIQIKYDENAEIRNYKKAEKYILEVDGVELPIPVSNQMILTIHNNNAGVLLILLSALASKEINVKDLQLGQRGNKGYAILGVEGNEKIVSNLLNNLGPQFHEISQILLNSNFAEDTKE